MDSGSKKSKKKNEASVVNDTNVEHDPAEGIHEKKIDSDGILHQGENEQKPKRPLNTYQLYANEVRGKVKAANPDLSGMEIVSIVMCSFFFAFFEFDHLPTFTSHHRFRFRLKRLLQVTKRSETTSAKGTRTRPPRHRQSSKKNTVRMQ